MSPTSTTRSTRKIVLDHYGLHTDTNGVVWLEQERGGTNALALAEKSPFTVQLRSKLLKCNHFIPLANPLPDLSHWFVYEQMRDDPLVRLLEPVPSKSSGGHFISDPRCKLTLHLVILSRLTSPIRSIVLNVHQTRPQTIINELSVTNCQPLVIVGLEPKHTELIETLSKVSLTSPRELILVGSDDLIMPSTLKSIETTITDFPVEDIAAIQWESIGATICRRFMRNEPREFDMVEWQRQRADRRARKPDHLR
ncbi:MAG: hypothetical protein GC184_06200 [Rhizobiales bacterium]|nr:hypothetical protein [Hyphomicrobiales bacterium]